MDAQKEEEQLGQLRRKIDAVDSSLVTLLAERAQLASAVGRVKGATAVYRPEREAEIFERVWEKSLTHDNPMKKESFLAIYREIISACRAAERIPRVAYLGPQGTFTEMAVLRQFGSSVESVPVASIDDAFKRTQAGACDFAVVPVENSTEGTINRTMDLLFSTPLTIVAEVNLPITHNLMNRSGALEDVKIVAAHPQALAQCRVWLTSHLPGVAVRAVSSNAEAAREAQNDPQMAAIAAARAADIYGLTIVAAGIQDDPMNRTRFLVLGHRMPDDNAQVPSKTSLVFSVANRAGALCQALQSFGKHGVSMLKVESRPARNGAWDYNFYVDVEGHCRSQAVSEAFAEISEVATFFKVLGSYPRFSS